MSTVTGLTRLPGQILLFVHMGNIRPVKKRNQYGGTCIVRDCRSFVDSCSFTNKPNVLTPKVEIHT